MKNPRSRDSEVEHATAPWEGRGADRITCLVADDHPAIVDAVSEFLEANGIEVTARARDGSQALAAITRELHPRIALLDIRMPVLSGTDIARRVAHLSPPTGGDRVHGPHRAGAPRRGARRRRSLRLSVRRRLRFLDLLRAVEIVNGATYVDPALAGVISASAANEHPALTAREREVLRLLADGLVNEEIGRRLFISPETVRTHVRKAIRKLDADTRTQAVAEAIRRSLIS